MKSVGYSTFYIDNDIDNANANDIDNANDNANDIDNANANDNDNDIQKQCLICLQGPIQSNNIIIDDVKLINKMHFLIKKCRCECYSHHTCIETWIQNNSICPICRGPISFPKSGIKEEIIQISNNDTHEIHEPHEIIVLDTNKSNHIWIRLVFILFFVCIIINILNNNVNM